MEEKLRQGVGPYCAHRSETTCPGRQVIPNDVSNVWCFAKSPIELGAKLTDARIARIRDDSEAVAADVSAGILELRVVEDVEEFDPDIERVVLMKYGSLEKPKSVLLNPGPWKNRRLEVPKVPK